MITAPPARRTPRQRGTEAVGRLSQLLPFDKRYYRSDGQLVWARLSVSLVRDDKGEPLYFISQIEDISERKRFEGQLQYLADHDALTGLFNRRRFEEELTRELATAERYGSGAAVLAIDLDNFKYINDSLGHSAGDDLIASVGSRTAGHWPQLQPRTRCSRRPRARSPPAGRRSPEASSRRPQHCGLVWWRDGGERK